MSYSKPRPYTNGPGRPRMDPPGTNPRPERVSTKHKRAEYGRVLILKAAERRARRQSRNAA